MRALIPILIFAAVPAAAAPRAAQAPPPRLTYPMAAVSDAAGGVWIADQDAPGVFRLEGMTLTLPFPGAKKFRTPLHRVRALVRAEDGSLFACDTATMDLYHLKAGQAPKALCAGALDRPMAVTLDAAGNPIVIDQGLRGLFRIPAAGGKPQQIAEVAAGRGVAPGTEPGSFVVLTHGKDQLITVAADGKVATLVAGRPFQFPTSVAADAKGWVVADNYARTIWRVSRSGEVTALFKGEPLVKPHGVAAGSAGAVLVADPGVPAIFSIDGDGKIANLVGP